MPRLKIPGFTERLEALFGQKGLSQRRFALQNELDQAKVQRWLDGAMPQFEDLEKLAKIFDVPWEWLLVGNDGVKVLEKAEASGKLPGLDPPGGHRVAHLRKPRGGAKRLGS